MFEKRSVIFWLGLIFGLCSVVTYGVTFFELEFGELGSTENDLPYILSIVELIFSGFVLVLVSVVYNKFIRSSVQSKSRQEEVGGRVALGFFVAMFLLEIAVTIIRAQHLGFLGDNVENTCSDTGKVTGCPTTRFEHVHDRDIKYREPLGGDCTFWFWGVKPASVDSSSGSMKRLVDMDSSSSQYRGIDLNDIETYMDWSEPESYGWRDDPDVLKTLTEVTSNTPRKYNVNFLMELQESVTALTPEERYDGAPDLEYCWYWGCSAVCNHERYRINRLWFGLSVLQTVLSVVYISLAYSVSSANRRDLKVEFSSEEAASVDEAGELMLPVYGRRKRLQNPSGLVF